MSIRDTVTGVQHVGIPTTDLEGTIAYYELPSASMPKKLRKIKKKIDRICRPEETF